RSILRRYAIDRDIVDLCCGSGTYLLPILRSVKSAVGIDFSATMLAGLRGRLNGASPSNLMLLNSDAAVLPIRDSSVDFVYSFASLYYLPRVDLAINGIARILRTGGVAALELGNVHSLNTLITAGFHSEGVMAKSYHISYLRMHSCIRDAGLVIRE